MKTLYITEEQFRQLVEDNNNSEAPNFDSKLKTFVGSEVSPTTNVTKQNGDEDFGKPIKTDDFADDQTNQNFFGPGLRGRRN